MNRIESLDLIEELFTLKAHNYIEEHFPLKFEDDIEALPFVWKLLYAAQDKFEQALSSQKPKIEALIEADSIFTSKSVQP